MSCGTFDSIVEGDRVYATLPRRRNPCWCRVHWVGQLELRVMPETGSFKQHVISLNDVNKIGD